MINKRSFGARVYEIAEDNGLEQTAVNRIINSYISLCRQDLLSGIEVRFFGLVTLVPDKKSSDYIATLAWYAKQVSEQVGYPYFTVLNVIKQYLSTSKRDLLEGKSVDIRSIVSLHPLYKNNELVKVYASISTSIKEDLLEINGDVTSARAHTCKLLKYDIARQLSESQEVLTE